MCIIRSYNVHDSFQPVATIEPTDSSTIRPLFHTDDVVEETKAIPSSIDIFSSKVDDATVVVKFPGAQAASIMCVFTSVVTFGSANEIC